MLVDIGVVVTVTVVGAVTDVVVVTVVGVVNSSSVVPVAVM